jgi:hypothetical protein
MFGNKCHSAVDDAAIQAYETFKQSTYEIFEERPEGSEIPDVVIEDFILTNVYAIRVINETEKENLCKGKKSTPEEANKKALRELADYFKREAYLCREKLEEEENKPLKQRGIGIFCEILDRTARELYNILGVSYKEVEQ